MTTDAAARPLALAVDIGGTKVEAAIVDADGRIVPGTRFRAATGPAAAADATVAAAAIDDVVGRTVASAPTAPMAAGIGSAGPLDLRAGAISPINLPAVRGFGVVDAVRRRTGIDDVTLRLDGTCIALAESWLGAARGVADAIVLVVSTGVGGGILSAGRLLAGSSGNAGHLGQLLIDRVETDPIDATVERQASGVYTVRWAQAAGWRGSTGEELAADYASGAPVAVAAVRRSAHALGRGLVNAATLLDLELAVIGGGFAAVSPDYLDLVGEAVRTNAVNEYARRLRVVAAELGPDAPLIGAGALVHRAATL